MSAGRTARAVSAGGPLRVGVVGLGWFGRIHLDAWAAVRGAAVVGVCDRDPAVFEVAQEAAQSGFHADAGGSARPAIGPQVRRCTSLSDLLHQGIDLLDVVVTEEEHAACVRAALAAGVDVVVEKPLATGLDAAVELAATAARQGRHIYAGQVLRFDPRHVALAELVRGQPLRHMSLSRHFQTRAHDVYGRAHPVLNASVHDIDLSVWLAGRAPERVSAYGSYFLGREHPDCVDLVLEWDGGLRAVIQNSWHLAASCPYGFVFDAVVHAAGASYTLRSEPVLQEWSERAAVSPELFFWPRYADQRQGALVAELQHFTDCAAAGVPSPRVPLADVLAVMSTCEAAMTALRTGGPVVPARAGG
ncbi:Gfo/Idh/MocA family protein [Plantactinospora sp. KBS50]|uniref:Gfo/Idh/MocA family protein n=1 Tax=Plantactinospora sp. KBS50 TaxID=2024580 RepID=UPI0012FD44F0|nr:Gfo/Idh/MocA family oxidoreductase [Plantactinospora sp. KBS50]